MFQTTTNAVMLLTLSNRCTVTYCSGKRPNTRSKYVKMSWNVSCDIIPGPSSGGWAWALSKRLTLRNTLPHGGQPNPWPRPFTNQRKVKAVRVEDWEKITLMAPTMRRPEEKSQRALIWSDSTPLMNLLMAYARVWLLVIRPETEERDDSRSTEDHTNHWKTISAKHYIL